jgi:RNA polymerase sigma-70 factor (ECF subfamily)
VAVLIADDGTVRDALAGDASAFDALLAPHLGPAFRMASVMLNDRAEAEDVVQEAALKAWSRLSQFRGDRKSFGPWFLSVVASECRMARRRPWWSVIRMADAPPTAGRATEDLAVGRLDLWRAIESLDADDRLALFTYYYLDLPLEAAAKVMGVPLGTAKSRIYRAARRLRPGVALEEVIDR